VSKMLGNGLPGRLSVPFGKLVLSFNTGHFPCNYITYIIFNTNNNKKLYQLVALCFINYCSDKFWLEFLAIISVAHEFFDVCKLCVNLSDYILYKIILRILIF